MLKFKNKKRIQNEDFENSLRKNDSTLEAASYMKRGVNVRDVHTKYRCNNLKFFYFFFLCLYN